MSDNNLYHLFRSRFPSDPNAPFLEHARGNTSFADLDNQSARLCQTLKANGVTKGDRVIVQVAKSPEAVILYLACLRAGAIFIPLNTAYTTREVAYFVQDANPRVVICDPQAKAGVTTICDSKTAILTLDANGDGTLIDQMKSAAPNPEIAPCRPNDLAAILYTSGTTGRSKGAMLTHDNLASNARVLHEYWQWQPDDVLLHALPIFHVHGLFVALHCALLNGSKVIFHSGFDVDAIIRDLPRSTVLMGVPTFYTRLLDAPAFNAETCRNMRLFISGSAQLLPETFAEFETLSGHTILERYGMTEAGMITSNPYDGARIAGTVGYALPGVTARVADENGHEIPRGEVGILEITGPNVFAGYWQMPEKTAEEFRDDGFFITGDMATMEPDGRISIVGRAKDLIITGGYNVYPKEVEIEIDNLPGVKESAVIGLPHADLGEAVTAVVVVNETAGLKQDDISGVLADKLARFKQPQKILFVSELPRNTMGKVQKKALREQYQDLYA
ncbi:malonate--CoA ligase [Profundibacter sp.]|uniref:malonate--CoA ligase n=1 Tax=Profundibacter sp. TaxID=3101071 RepID=UPI003D0DA15B